MTDNTKPEWWGLWGPSCNCCGDVVKKTVSDVKRTYGQIIHDASCNPDDLPETNP